MCHAWQIYRAGMQPDPLYKGCSTSHIKDDFDRALNEQPQKISSYRYCLKVFAVTFESFLAKSCPIQGQK